MYCVYNDCTGSVVTEADMVAGAGPEDDGSWIDDFRLYNDLAQALSCFSYYYSKQNYILVNVQGVRGIFTNPDFHFVSGENPFSSPNDGGREGVTAFFSTFVHSELSRQLLRTLPDFAEEWLNNGER